MKNYFAKKSWASYVMLGALIFAIVALVMSVLSNSYGTAAGNYGVDHISAVIAYDVVAMVLCVVAFAVDGIYINDFINKILSIAVDIIRFLAALFLILGMAYMVSDRGQLMGFVWFSTLLSGDANGVAAMNDALYSWIFYAIAIVCVAVSSGANLCLKKAAKTEAAA